MLSNFLHVSPEIFTKSIPHLSWIILCAGRHGVDVLDHLQDGCIGGLVDELQAIRRIEDFMKALGDMAGSLERRGVLISKRNETQIHVLITDLTVL